MPNEYTQHWFDVFLETMPTELTTLEVDALETRFPRPQFARVLDICCGPARHAKHLVERGYDVTGIDRDATAISAASQRCPTGRFVELDQRDIGTLAGPFDAAVIMWQSFGFFDSATNDRVLADIVKVLRPGGRLVLDLFHRTFFERNQSRITSTRDPRCVAITNKMTAGRLTSTIEYANGSAETMQFELFTPEEVQRRAEPLGLDAIETCCWWDPERPASPDEQRFQVTFQRL